MVGRPTITGAKKSQDLIAGQWLCQIFDSAHVAGHFAVEIQTGDLTHDKHVDIRLHHLRQIEQRAQRFVLATDVDDQAARRSGFLHRGDGGPDAATRDLERMRRGIGQAVAQRDVGGGIGNEGDQHGAVAVRDPCVLRLPHVPELGAVIGHQLLVSPAADGAALVLLLLLLLLLPSPLSGNGFT